MADIPSDLNRRGERAIAALLETSNITEAARIADVPSRTLYRWLREDETFKAAYRVAKWTLVEQAITFLQKATGRAVQELVTILEDGEMPGSVRVSAAKTILEMALRGVEIEHLTARIEALEQTQRGSLNGTHAARY